MKQYQTFAKTLAIPDTKAVVKFLGLAIVAIFLPFFIHLQWITGPVVNAVLILAVFLLGIRSALFIALIPSVIALSSGLLPTPLAPMVPFIMLGNAVLVICVDWFARNYQNKVKGYWAGVSMGALLKFALLFYASDVVIGLLAKQELAVKVAQMMSWPQFVTAVAGGVLAWGFLRMAGMINDKEHQGEP
jgi:hypothetical protein